MDIRRQAALLIFIGCCGFALLLPMLTLTAMPDGPDPLAPLSPLVSLDHPSVPDPVMMDPLRTEASAALDALRAAPAASSR
jgi:hypothetical protein